jgi:hypothetical protein
MDRYGQRIMRSLRTCLVTCLALLSGCGDPAGVVRARVDAASGRCHIRGPLPDARCTPGAVDASVTQLNIRQTICVRGYARRARPPSDYTDSLKRTQVREYGFYGGRRLRAYEEDHLVPLELGGAPRDRRNLWPERRTGRGGSAQKDAVENLLHRRVCVGTMTLAAAQRDFERDWYAAYVRDLGGGSR